MPVNPAASFEDSADNQFTSAKLARMGMGADVMMPPARSEPHLIRKLFVEFLGDTIFVFIGTMSATGIVGNGDGNTGAGIAAPAFAHGLTIAVLILCFGHISGGHFNPAVTLGIFLSGNIHWKQALLYVPAQLLGGIFGDLLVRACVSYEVYSEVVEGGMTIMPDLIGKSDGSSWWQGIIVELILTFILVNSVLMTAVDTDSNMLAPLAIGLSLTLDIFGAGAITGASMNPARSFGPALMTWIFANHDVLRTSAIWSRHYVYWVGPVLGSSLAAGTYKLILANDDNRILL